MSWLFGRKKHHKDSPQEEHEPEEDQTSSQDDDYVHLNRWPNSMPANTGPDGIPYPTGNLYPHVPPVSNYGQPFTGDALKDSSQGEHAYYLTGVPFKLCKQLENNLNSDLEIDKLRISEVLSFIERIRDQNYDYSFSTEESVIAEMNSRNDE